MKIEFRKIPFEAKDFSFTSNSVIFEGKFGRMTPTLAKFDAKMCGTIKSSCYKCGDEINLNINEAIDFIVSDGIYEDDKHEETVIEVDNNIIDFDQLIDSEIVSINSDYHVCKNCDNNELFEKEL